MKMWADDRPVGIYNELQGNGPAYDLFHTISQQQMQNATNNLCHQLIMPRHLHPEEFDNNGMFIVPKEITVEKKDDGILLKCDTRDVDILRKFLEGGFLTINQVREILYDHNVIKNKEEVFLKTDVNDWRKIGVMQKPQEVPLCNCRNCGAPVPRNGTCEYCGTNY